MEKEKKKGLFSRLVSGLTKTRNNVVSGIDSIFSGFSSIDDDFYDEIEEILIMGDLGVETTEKIIDDLKDKVKENKIKKPDECKQLLMDSIKEQMNIGENAYDFENEKSVMFILNDYAPDGKDVSWIWDANFEEINNIPNLKTFYCVGTRAEDLALRLKYAGVDEGILKVYPAKDQFDINEAVDTILNEDIKSFVIGTFTAMPEARKILLKKEADGF